MTSKYLNVLDRKVLAHAGLDPVSDTPLVLNVNIPRLALSGTETREFQRSDLENPINVYRLNLNFLPFDRLSERLVWVMSLQKLDINVYWELTVPFGNARFRHLADIVQKSRLHCGTHFLALDAAEETSDICPICGIQQYYQRLTQAGLLLRAAKQGVRRVSRIMRAF